MASAILLVGRILLVALFAHSARGHIQNHARLVTTAQGRLPLPYVAGWPTGVWLLLADLLMVLTQEGAFYRNVSLLGASLALFVLFSVIGAGRFAITGPLLKLG